MLGSYKPKRSRFEDVVLLLKNVLLVGTVRHEQAPLD